MKRGRREVKEAGGKRTVIIEPGDRRIIRQDNRVIINHNETLRFQQTQRDGRFERRRDGNNLFIYMRPGRVEVINVTDPNGRLLRRYRRYPDGREVTLIDNRPFYRRYPRRTGFFVGVALAPLALAIPRREYIVDYRDASEEVLYDTLSAPPLERLDRRYTLEEVRYSHSLRERLRRVDLDLITFDTGSWEISQGEMQRLERIARVLRRLIERNPEEIFLIEGYTDAVGPAEDNLTLSDRRAESVAIALTEAFGIPPENLVTQGYGEEFMKVPTDGPERANRRVAVRRITPLMARN